MDVKMPDGTIVKNVPDHYNQEDLLEQYQQMSGKTPTSEAPKVKMDDFPRYKEENSHKFIQAQPYKYPFVQSVVTGLSGLQGALNLPAGALQLAGINKPAEALRKNQEWAEGVAPYASTANTAGELASSFLLPEASIPKLGASVVGKYAVPSAIQAGLAPVDTRDKGYLDTVVDKFENMLAGGATGGVLGKTGQMIMSPQVSARLQQLKDLGMTKFTPGQLASQFPVIGEGLQRIEKGLTSLPFTGSVIGQGLKTSFDDFNKAIGNKVLSNLGLKLNKDAPVGNEMVDAINQKIKDAYDTFLQKAKFSDAFNPKTGKNTSEHLSDIADMAMSKLSPTNQQIMANDISKNVTGHLQNERVWDGEQFREIERGLTKSANEYYKMGEDGLGHAYKTVLSALRDELKRQNPTMAEQLEKAHKAFRELQPLEVAASRRGAKEGAFTPDQFKSAVQQVGGKKATASGKAMMTRESQAAEDILGNNIPNSGTIDRYLAAGILGGTGYVGANEKEYPLLSHVAAPLALATAAYNPYAMKAITKMATERPDVMRNLSPEVSKTLSKLGTSLVTKPSEPKQ